MVRNRKSRSASHASSEDQAQPQPKFQFVTATNPDQFSDHAKMRDIRRHVMMDYLAREESKGNSTDRRVARSRQDAKRKRSSEPLSSSPEGKPAEVVPGRASNVPERGTTPSNSSVTSFPSLEMTVSSAESIPRTETDASSAIASDLLAVDTGWPFVIDPSWDQLTNVRNALAKRPRVQSAPSRYQEAFTTKEQLRQLGASIDPFHVGLKFKSGTINVENFKRDCTITKPPSRLTNADLV